MSAEQLELLQAVTVRWPSDERLPYESERGIQWSGPLTGTTLTVHGTLVSYLVDAVGARKCLVRTVGGAWMVVSPLYVTRASAR